MSKLFGVIKRSYSMGNTAADVKNIKELFKNGFLRHSGNGKNTSAFVVNKKNLTGFNYYIKRSFKTIKDYVAKDHQKMENKVNTNTILTAGVASTSVYKDERDLLLTNPYICKNTACLVTGQITNHQEVVKKLNLVKGTPILDSYNNSNGLIVQAISKLREKHPNIELCLRFALKHIKGPLAVACIDLENGHRVTFAKRGMPLHFRYLSTQSIIVFGSYLPSMRKSYMTSKIPISSYGNHYYDWKEIYLDDGGAITFDASSDNIEWVTRAKQFSLTVTTNQTDEGTKLECAV